LVPGVSVAIQRPYTMAVDPNIIASQDESSGLVLVADWQGIV
jgi:hypothetical protein